MHPNIKPPRRLSLSHHLAGLIIRSDGCQLLAVTKSQISQQIKSDYRHHSSGVRCMTEILGLPALFATVNVHLGGNLESYKIGSRLVLIKFKSFLCPEETHGTKSEHGLYLRTSTVSGLQIALLGISPLPGSALLSLSPTTILGASTKITCNNNV